MTWRCCASIALVMPALNRLHEDIDNTERLNLIGEFPVAQIVSAPGHQALRNPDAVVELAWC